MESGALYQTIGRALALIRAAGAAFTQVTRGLASAVTRTGAGVYVVTVGQPCTPTGAIPRLTLNGLVGAYGVASPDATGTVWTISTFVNTAGVSTATDIDFSFSVEQLDGT